MKLSEATDYHTYRQWLWKKQKGAEHFDFHRDEYTGPGKRKLVGYLQPKRNLFFKDVIHCTNAKEAREYARHILRFDDIRSLELKGSWLWIDWGHQGKVHELPGQDLDDRSRVTG